LSRLDPGITRPCPDLADSSSTLPFLLPARGAGKRELLQLSADWHR
jgi:hypothetical protein